MAQTTENLSASSSMPSPASVRSPAWLPLTLALLPWPAVYCGLFILHNVWAAFFLYHSVCLGGWFFCRTHLPPLAKPVWLRRQWIGLGIVCLSVNLAVYLFAGLFTTLLAPEHLRLSMARIHAGQTLIGKTALFAYFAAVNPLAEELFWRGVVFARLRLGRWPASWCAFVSGVLFGAWHWLPVGLLLTRDIALIAVAGIILVGILLALFYDRTRNLFAPILLHALGADVPILIALWVDVYMKR